MDLGFMRGLRNEVAARFRSTREMDAAELLLDCLRAGEPVVVMTGAAGLGKSTVLNMALEQLGPSDPRILLVEPPFPAPVGLQLRLAALLGLSDAESTGPAELARALRSLPAPGEGVAALAVIIDSAETVPLPVLQYLWLMHTVAWVERPALQLVLVGRDALWRQLGEEKLAGLRRGVTARLALQPFPADEAAEFLQYLLRLRRRRADADAVAEILEAAAGVPGRLISLLDAGLPGRRATTLGGVQSAAEAAPPNAAPSDLSAQPAAQSSSMAKAVSGSMRLPLQLGMAAAGFVLLIAAWQVLGRGGSGTRPADNRRGRQDFAVVTVHTNPESPSASAATGIGPLPSPDASPPAPRAAVLSLPDGASLKTAAVSLVAVSSSVGSVLGGLVQQADRTLSDLMTPSQTVVAIQSVLPPAKSALPASPALETAVAAAAVPLPARPPSSAAGATTAPALPMLVMADTTAAHVVLEYPGGDQRAQVRARGAAAALRQAGLDAADPVAVSRYVGRSAIKYFFVDDRESAKRVAQALGGAVGRFSVDESSPQAIPPAPGMLEVVVAGR